MSAISVAVSADSVSVAEASKETSFQGRYLNARFSMNGGLSHTSFFLTIIHNLLICNLKSDSYPVISLNREPQGNLDCLDQLHETLHGATVTG